MDKPVYEFTGPNADGLIRLEMPNLDPGHAGEFFCITIGTDKEAIAEAMCKWLGSIDYGECDEEPGYDAPLRGLVSPIEQAGTTSIEPRDG